MEESWLFRGYFSLTKDIFKGRRGDASSDPFTAGDAIAFMYQVMSLLPGEKIKLSRRTASINSAKLLKTMRCILRVCTYLSPSLRT